VDEDLDSYLEDHGKPCSCGAKEFLGILEQPDMEVGLGKHSTTSTMFALTIKTSVIAAAGMKSGTLLLVEDTRYAVRDFQRLDDGAFTQVNISQK
jgi:hypothetical protein